MLVLVRKQDSNWPRPSRRPSKPPRATFDVPAANNHLQRQPRSYLARSSLSRPLDRRNHGGRNQRLQHHRGRHCRLHPRGSRVDGRMTLLSANPLWPAAAAAPPSLPFPPIAPPPRLFFLRCPSFPKLSLSTTQLLRIALAKYFQCCSSSLIFI